MKINILALSGSLRKASYTTKLLKAFEASAPETISFTYADVGSLPHFNQDLEENPPKEVEEFHRQVSEADAVLFATPEYNHSYSPVIKNAIDWGSRPQGKNKWDGKPGAIIACSPFDMGGFGAANHLRQVLVYINIPTLQQPEIYVRKVAEKMDDEGNITDKETQEFIDKFWKAFADWIERNSAK